MSGYYGRRRRYDPRAEERKEREAKDQARVTRDKARLGLILRNHRKVLLRGDEAQAAWGGKQLRSFTVGRTRDGEIPAIIRTNGKGLYLQEPSGIGWAFYKLERVRRFKAKTKYKVRRAPRAPKRYVYSRKKYKA